MEYWTRNDAEHRWESRCGKWFAYDQWSCGRITQMRQGDLIPGEGDPTWDEMYQFARSQTAGRVTDGRA